MFLPIFLTKVVCTMAFPGSREVSRHQMDRPRVALVPFFIHYVLFSSLRDLLLADNRKQPVNYPLNMHLISIMSYIFRCWMASNSIWSHGFAPTSTKEKCTGNQERKTCLTHASPFGCKCDLGYKVSCLKVRFSSQWHARSQPFSPRKRQDNVPT